MSDEVMLASIHPTLETFKGPVLTRWTVRFNAPDTYKWEWPSTCSKRDDHE